MKILITRSTFILSKVFKLSKQKGSGSYLYV